MLYALRPHARPAFRRRRVARPERCCCNAPVRLVLTRVALVLAAVFVAALALEIGARLLGGAADERAARLFATGADDDPPRAQALEDQRVIVHPYFGYVVDPRAKGINAFGFFRDPPLTTRAPDRLVIAVFGGSVADQVFALGRQALVERLGAAPPFRGRRIEVISTALGGYKQPQQMLVLAALLAFGAQFDVVVNLDGFNEVDAASDNVQDGVYPYFPHNWHLHARRALDADALRLVARAEAARAERAALRRRFAIAPVRHSAFLLALWDALDRRQLARLRTDMAALDAALGAAQRPPQVSGPPARFADRAAMFADFVEVWARASHEMESLSRGRGIQYLHFLQPNQYLEDSKALTAAEREVAWDAEVAEAGRVRDAYPLLVARGRELVEQGVDFHDLTAIFASEAGPIYVDPCCHFNQRGAELVATAIADAIIARNQDD